MKSTRRLKADNDPSARTEKPKATMIQIRSRVRLRAPQMTGICQAIVLAGIFGCILANGQRSQQCMACLKHCALEWDSVGGLIGCRICLGKNNCNDADLSLFFFDYHCVASPVPERVQVTLQQILMGAQSSSQSSTVNQTVRKQGNRQPVVRSYSGRTQQDNPMREVCPTTTKIYRPRTAEHTSGLIVRLVNIPGITQFFYMGECRYSRPLISMNPPGRCVTVKQHHKALFTVSQRDMLLNGRNKFHNCHLVDPFNKNYFCQDWVKLNATCSLFI